MWKKSDSAPLQPEGKALAPVPVPALAPAAAPTPAAAPAPDPARNGPVETGRDKATIGPSITIKGELIGDEDLLIQGTVEGRVNLRKHNITVGKSGRIKADLFGQCIHIEGEVEGNLFGDEQVVVRRRAREHHRAPRLTRGWLEVQGQHRHGTEAC